MLSVKRNLFARNILGLEYLPHLPDLAHCDFLLFEPIKSILKRTRVKSIKKEKQKLTKLLDALTKDDFQHSFDEWKKQIERCVVKGREYTEEEYSI